MFRQIRYQTGELNEIITEMKKGNIPCMDVNDNDELNWFVNQLAIYEIFIIKDIPYDKNARDKVKEPEFEYRVGFYTQPVALREIKSDKIMYIDFYFEPYIDENYDSVGEM